MSAELRILLEAWNDSYHTLENVTDALIELGARVEWYDTTVDKGYGYALGAYMAPETAIKAGIPAEVIKALMTADWAVYAWPPVHEGGPWEIADRVADRIEAVHAAAWTSEDTGATLFGTSREKSLLISIFKLNSEGGKNDIA